MNISMNQRMLNQNNNMNDSQNFNRQNIQKINQNLNFQNQNNQMNNFQNQNNFCQNFQGNFNQGNYYSPSSNFPNHNFQNNINNNINNNMNNNMNGNNFNQGVNNLNQNNQFNNQNQHNQMNFNIQINIGQININQNMKMNEQGNIIQNNQNNFNQNGNNSNNIEQNLNNNFNLGMHHPVIDKSQSLLCIISHRTPTIDNNETNTIKSIIQLFYSNYNENENNKLSLIISREIKRKLGGEWFVFVYNKNKKIYFNISSVSESDFLVMEIKDSEFKIAKMK